MRLWDQRPSNRPDYLGLIHDYRERTEPDMDSAACYAINNLRNLGNNNPSVVETGDDCGTDLNLLGTGCREDFSNLRWIDRRGHVAVDDLQFSASGLVRDCRYLSLDNFAIVEAHMDAGAYAVVHKSNYTRRRGRDCSALG